jgi:hypothetical protein
LYLPLSGFRITARIGAFSDDNADHEFESLGATGRARRFSSAIFSFKYLKI